MSAVYFLSDLHLAHKNICKFREGFTSVEEHNALIKENYHKRVTKRDTVYFLGDVAFDKESLADVKTWAGAKKILICGNHDLDHHTMKDLVEAYDEVYSLKKYKEFWLSHAPIHPDELRGKVNIHGHTHYHNIADDRYVNVSLENINFTPIELHEIRRNLNVK
jgi:calcineurin-like phosphoesterase family protein